MALIDKLTNIADAIRGKTGGTEEMTLDAMAEAIAGIEDGGDNSTVTSLIDGNIKEIYDDKAMFVRESCFANCSSLLSVDLPNVIQIRATSFSFCTNLTSVNLPKLQSWSGSNHFQACYALVFIKLPSVTKLENQHFNRCSNLKTVVLPQTTLVSLSNVSVFNSSPFASGGTGGTVYVPSALIESYKTATNWSTLHAAGTCNFVAIEGSEYE